MTAGIPVKKEAAEHLPFFFAGERIASFQLVRCLRVRPLSECWLAVRLDTGLSAAVKFLRKEHPRIPQFYDTAEFLRTCTNPFLIRVFEYGETAQDMPYAVMEYADGGSLRKRLTKGGALPLPDGVALLRGTLLALRELHEHGIVHRDVKPDNIWYLSDGTFRLGDLGTAKLPGFAEEPGAVFGTASYLSPEQARDSTAVDARSDLYSLALVLFEALTGKRRRPRIDNFAEALRNVLADHSAPPVEEMRLFATGKLASLLGRMMEYSPALRPSDAAHALAELDTMELPAGNS